MKIWILAFILILGMASRASAKDCVFNGKTYPPGTNIGGLVCQPDGTWKPKS